MKNSRNILSILLLAMASLQALSQTVTFDTFTLSPNSYYQDNSGTDFTANGVKFEYGWNGTYNIWETGTAYTNVNDTVNGTYTNLYGCIPGAAFSGNNYATVQAGAKVVFSNTTTAVSGFYITNTTYAWKEIKKGGYGRKFGDTTGTGSGQSILQGEYPDWFKVIVKGFRGGNITNDSVQFYLADYRAPGTANDYVVKNWQFVNCLPLGQIDSLVFQMRSSDYNGFGMKTPAFFSIDNFTTVSTVGLTELENISELNFYPNPATENIFLKFKSRNSEVLTITLSDLTGKQLFTENRYVNQGFNYENLNLTDLEAGIYFIKITGTSNQTFKFIKN